MFFITALKVNENNGAYVPALYVTNNLSVPIFSYFTGKLNYTGRDSPPHSNNGLAKGPIYVSSSKKFASGSIPAASIIALSLKAFKAKVPSWISLLPLPSISVVSFSSTTIVAVAIASTSDNIYYIYYEETSIPYNIEGYNYTIPMYYFYINYTTS